MLSSTTTWAGSDGSRRMRICSTNRSSLPGIESLPVEERIVSDDIAKSLPERAAEISSGRIVAPSGVIVTAQQARDAINGCLRRTYGRERHGAKIMARRYDWPPETCKNWLDDTSLVTTDKLMTMCANDPAMWETVCRLTGHTGHAHHLTPHQWEKLRAFFDCVHAHFAHHSPAVPA